MRSTMIGETEAVAMAFGPWLPSRMALAVGADSTDEHCCQVADGLSCWRRPARADWRIAAVAAIATGAASIAASAFAALEGTVGGQPG